MISFWAETIFEGESSIAVPRPYEIFLVLKAIARSERHASLVEEAIDNHDFFIGRARPFDLGCYILPSIVASYEPFLSCW